MKPLHIFIAVFGFAATFPANASTLVLDITPEYVRAHPNEVSVKVSKDHHGLLAFTAVFTFDEPKFIATQLTVQSGDRVLAETYTTALTRESRNTYTIVLAPECLAKSGFTLSTSGAADSDGKVVRKVGGIDYRLRLPEFVSPELLNAPSKE